MDEPADRSGHPVSQPIDKDEPSLITLPGEIRNAIYEELLVHEEPIIAADENDTMPASKPTLRLGTALLATCRQIHSEASPCFYSSNVFLASSISVEHPASTLIDWIAEWLKKIGTQAKHVRSITLDYLSIYPKQ